MNFEAIFKPLKLGNEELPHRIIMGSMHLGLEEFDNCSERMTEFYKTRFLGGACFITTGGISVNEAGKGSNIFFNFLQDEHCKRLEKVTKALYKDGIFCAQLFHAGRYSYHRKLVAPSALRAPINRYVPHELTEKEAWDTIEDFSNSALIAKELGFRAVEIMGSEGYLINQFFSPVTNQRNDFFGGNPEKRNNFAIETLKAVRKKVGENFPIVFRMSGIDLIPGNPTFEEVIELAKQLKNNGANALNIGIGWHESRIPTISMLVPRGSWVKIASKIKKEVSGIPIIASNRINTPEIILRSLIDENIDLVSLARPFLADPNLVNKLKNHEQDRINTCIACNQACLDHTFKEKMVSCLVNPSANREIEFKKYSPKSKKRIVVVGSGPGGLEASRVAKEKGHEVTLIEASSMLGGQLNLAAKIPGKYEFKETIRYFTIELKRLGVNILLNTKATLKLLEELNPDVIIFSTGVKPRGFQLKGLENVKHADYFEYLSGNFTPGKNVIIIGGGGIGVDVAHHLTEKYERTIDEYFTSYNVQSYTNVGIQSSSNNRNINIFRRSGKIGAGLGVTTSWALLEELKNKGVHFHTSLDYKEFNDDLFKIATKSNGDKDIPCDSVIICAGQVSENSLANEYREKYPSKETYVIGGAKDSSGIDAKRAMLEGFETVLNLN